MADTSINNIRTMIDFLVENDYLEQTREEFLTVSGVGAIKADKYGDAFTALIREEGNLR